MANGDDVIRIARAQIGKPYVWAKAGPNSFDCSGLVVYSYRIAAGVNLPHFTGALITKGVNVNKADLKPGDLVFPDSGHVQIYTGNGMVVEAPHSGANVREVKMWGFWHGRRIITPGTGQGGTGGGVEQVSNTSTIPAVFGGLDDKFKWITDAHNWARIGWFVVGFGLALFAIIRWNPNVASAVKGVAKGAKR